MRFNSSKRRFISPPLRSLLPFATPLKIASTNFDFTVYQFALFLFKPDIGLWQHIKITNERKAAYFNSPKRGFVPPPPRSPLPLCTPPNTTFTKFEFTAHQFALFLFKLSSSLWQRVNIIYERKALSHSGLSMHKYQPKALMSGKHNK